MAKDIFIKTKWKKKEVRIFVYLIACFVQHDSDPSRNNNTMFN
jgi:hypothetical protein